MFFSVIKTNPEPKHISKEFMFVEAPITEKRSKALVDSHFVVEHEA